MSDSAFVFEAHEANFNQAVIARSHEVPVLVDFWADWCGPCHSLMPVLFRVIDSLQGAVELAKVNTDENRALASGFGVRSLPTVKLFRGGKVVSEFMGVQPESAIRAFLECYLPRTSDALLVEAEQALAGGDAERAIVLLRQAVADDPDNDRGYPQLAEILLGLGRVQQADDIVRSAPAKLRNTDVFDGINARIRLAQSSGGAEDEYSLRASLDNDPENCETRFRLGTYLAAKGEHEAALEELLTVLRANRTFQDGAARKAMVDIFQSLGNSGPVVTRYRGLLSAALH